MENTNVVKGFKVFRPDWSCRPNGNFKQYTCPGKFEEDVTPVRFGGTVCRNMTGQSSEHYQTLMKQSLKK